MGLFRRRGEQRTIGYWPGWSSDPWDPSCPMPEDRALRIADIYACVKVLSDAAASVPLIPYRRSDTGRVRLDSGRLYELLQKPSPATSQANLVAQAMAHLTLWGNAYLGKFRDQDGRLEQLAMLHPDKVTVELKGGQPLYTVTGTKGEQSKHGTDDIVHLRALSTDGLLGMSPIKQCRVALALADGLGTQTAAFFENGARPSGILTLPAGSTSQQLESTFERLEDRHAGAKNAHKIAIVAGDIQWTALAGPLDDVQFVEQRKLSTAEIARIFRVPPWMIGASSGDSMTYANVEQQQLAFVTHSLRPWLVVIEQAISADPDLCSAAVYVEFLLDALLRADSKTRAEVYTLALNPDTGWMRRDEVRRLENLEPEPQQGAIQ
jgi:HK97 family phage portal protein